jgi:hypothetical protein
MIVKKLPTLSQYPPLCYTVTHRSRVVWKLLLHHFCVKKIPLPVPKSENVYTWVGGYVTTLRVTEMTRVTSRQMIRLHDYIWWTEVDGKWSGRCPLQGIRLDWLIVMKKISAYLGLWPRVEPDTSWIGVTRATDLLYFSVLSNLRYVTVKVVPKLEQRAWSCMGERIKRLTHF